MSDAEEALTAIRRIRDRLDTDEVRCHIELSPASSGWEVNCFLHHRELDNVGCLGSDKGSLDRKLVHSAVRRATGKYERNMERYESGVEVARYE